ncbi:PGAP1-like protein-domain-containing protein [Multifurca ochricompacta]|uniref:GPI inositol-deacylase n=1 Tax=Multifurca ochricompacta TaxID=376703 RepID=A0AAD4M032_9AGAM|nr:PGAP1-like protein-domain-containing protein [Multifurca ochricompacta]
MPRSSGLVMTRTLSIFLGLFSIISVGIIYRAVSDSAVTLSPQGCRMSYMSPSYLVQSQFDTSWTPLASRYSLLLYREVGWEDNELRGVPVLFIPGNAGSSHQIRSIASSAARQYYTSPYVPSSEFISQSIKPLDFFAVEYNEDLSAFHGPTLDVETAYASSAISYILSLYPKGTSIVVMGHSMGGIVATSLLPSPNISAVITMSTPHQIPPARFDRRIAAIYENNQASLTASDTPILSLCGGATDLMVPSESCVLPEVTKERAYRRTIFSSALEGCWTGVGHQVMVWCHQVRWRVARAALELGTASSSAGRGLIFDRWFRDGRSLSPSLKPPAPLDLNQESYIVLPSGPLVLRDLRKSKAVYLAPVPKTNSPTKFVAYVSEGSVLSVAPHHTSSLSVSFYLCTSSTDDPHSASYRPTCEEWEPTSLRLIPNASPEKPFPVPHEGVDESEGIIVFESTLSESIEDEYRWVSIVYSNDEGRGWVIGSFVEDKPILKTFSVYDLLYKDVSITVHPDNILTKVQLPSLLSNALLVYRVSATYASERSCNQPLLSPLLEHASHFETHFHPLTQSRPLLLHAHTGAPFTSSPHTHGVNLTLYVLPDCNVTSLRLRVDWWGTLGRMGARYWAAVPGWAVGVVAWVLFNALGIHERGAPMPSVAESLSIFTRETLPSLLGVFFVLSLLPLPNDYLLGNQGEFIFASLTPLILLLVTGLVTVSWWLVCVFMWSFGKLGKRFLARKKVIAGISKTTILSMVLILLLVAIIIPWQVAFLGCWIIHLVTCATTYTTLPSSNAITPPPPPRSPSPTHKRNTLLYPPRIVSPITTPIVATPPASSHDGEHLLLLLTWLLPLSAPVLAVWVRTLATTPRPTALGSVGSGDHNLFSVAPYLILVDYASWTRESILLPTGDRLEWVSARWLLLLPALIAFFRGTRHTYEVFDWVWAVMTTLVVLRVGPRYLGGGFSSSWSKVFRLK